MIRKASVAGQFYSADKEELENEVREYLTSKKDNIRMAISPHAGYVFSGRLAGDVLGRFEGKKDFIILGVNHSGIGGKITISQNDFETPLRIIKNNKDLGSKILKKLKDSEKSQDSLNLSPRRLAQGFAEINEQAHEKEHSIEVQLPFLQLSQKKFSIVPILLKDLSYEECSKIAEILEGFIDNNIGVIVSSDFTHYGRNYGFIPFTKDIQKKYLLS